jgi:hypothetical protein
MATRLAAGMDWNFSMVSQEMGISSTERHEGLIISLSTFSLAAASMLEAADS